MLAEPRRKQRVGPNPRGNFFVEDGDNRGRKMLEKMGWKTGDGLGVKKDGIVEPVKLKIQTDSKGIVIQILLSLPVGHMIRHSIMYLQ